MRGKVAKILRAQAKDVRGAVDWELYKLLKQTHRVYATQQDEPLPRESRWERGRQHLGAPPWGKQAIHPSRHHPLRALGNVFGFLPTGKMRAALNLEKTAGTLPRPELLRRVEALVALAVVPEDLREEV